MMRSAKNKRTVVVAAAAALLMFVAAACQPPLKPVGNVVVQNGAQYFYEGAEVNEDQGVTVLVFAVRNVSSAPVRPNMPRMVDANGRYYNARSGQILPTVRVGEHRLLRIAFDGVNHNAGPALADFGAGPTIGVVTVK